MCLEKLELAKNCDGKIKQNIQDNIKFFEILGLTKEALKNRFPVKIDASLIKNSEEAVALKNEIDTLDSLKDKSMEIIERIFETLNEDNVIPQMIRVLQKKSTEKAVNLNFLTYS